MNCDKATQIQSYLDNEMDAAQKQVLEAHLAQCAECSSLLEELRGLSAMIARAPKPEMRSGAMNRYYDAFNAARDRAVLRITSWLTAVAAGLLIGAILTWPAEEPSTTAPKSARSGTWEQFAVMPPPADTQGENGAQLVQVAQWMANDLSLGGGERR